MTADRPLSERVREIAEKGPVRLLCDEIGFRFDPRLEHPAVLVEFVRELVNEIADMRSMRSRIAERAGKPPSKSSGDVLALSRKMLAFHWSETRGLVAAAARVHGLAHELNPDEKVPTDHLIDMLSSCASAVRFGLETPCRSRHAAAAAQHVWAQLYGLGRFDIYTSAWEKDWARAKFQDAIVGMASAIREKGA